MYYLFCIICCVLFVVCALWGAQKEAQICKDFSVLLHLNDYCGYNNPGGGEGGRSGESKTLFSVGTLKVLMDVGM